MLADSSESSQESGKENSILAVQWFVVEIQYDRDRIISKLLKDYSRIAKSHKSRTCKSSDIKTNYLY